jgi:hypothetical protein
MLPGVARVPESRTEGALKDETTWPWAGAWALAALTGLAGGALAGCSAIVATVECREAERAVAHAIAAKPEGIYQLTLARAYLEKAREEASEAHYGSAARLAQAAKAKAKAAIAPGASASSQRLGSAE